MGLAVLAILSIIAGLAVRAAGPRLLPARKGTDVTSSGRSILLSYSLLVLGGVLFALNAVTIIDVGEVGVKHFLGTVDEDVLEQGVHFVNPFASIEKMSVREQGFPTDGGIERMEAQTAEQLTVQLDVALLYRIDGQRAPELYQRIGTEDEIKSRIVLNAMRNGVRDAIATKSINEIFSASRRAVADAMKQEIQAKAGDRIEVLEVFVRDITAPPRVREAIEAKLQREQQVAAERFQTEIIQERANQKAEEAKGIAEAQGIISQGLTREYLTFMYIEQLGKLPEGALIVVPTEGGVPLLRTVGRP